MEYIFESCALNPLLTGFASYGYKLLYDSPYKNDIYAQRAIQINPYVKFNPDKEKIMLRQKMLAEQIKLWQEEMHDLGNSASDVKRKHQLATWIIQEGKRHDPSLEKYLNYQGQNIPLSFLNPRFFYEEGLNCVIIKDQAYRLGVRSTIREAMLKRGNGAIGEYFVNSLEPIEDTGLTPTVYSHTLGDSFEENGPADIFLIKEDAKTLYAKKHKLSDTIAQKIMYREVPCSDNEINPFVTNLVHISDNPFEAAIHYLTAYPEHQAMTRFMYPNPRLERVRKK